jgi:hypothetical protein
MVCSANKEIKNDKAIPVAGLRGPQDRETSRLPHCLDNRFIDGGVDGRPIRPGSSWYPFLLGAEYMSTPGP